MSKTITQLYKNDPVNWFKEYRNKILSETDPREIRISVEVVERRLKTMQRDGVEGDLNRIIQRTLETIEKFWLHDETRHEVCRWIQTVCSQLLQAK